MEDNGEVQGHKGQEVRERRCPGLSTGSRSLDEVLGLGIPSLVILRGAHGSGKSAVLRAAVSSYATSCGRAALLSVGRWERPEYFSGLPEGALDRILLMRLADEESLTSTSRAVLSIDLGMVALDSASDLSGILRSAAPQVLLALSLSRAVHARRSQVLVSIHEGPSGPIGYDSWWPYADLEVSLEVIGGDLRRASSARGEAVFRLRDGYVEGAESANATDK